MEFFDYDELVLDPEGYLWIFGYGSIIWKWGVPNVEPLEVIRCKTYGWRRTFNQGSTDNRGTPEYPGRTVTLEQCSQKSVI